MLHPVGSQPPAVYWRRRLLFVAALVLVVVLLVLTGNTLLSGGSGTPAAAGAPPTSPHASTPASTPTGRSSPAGDTAAVAAQGQDHVSPPAGSTTPTGTGSTGTGAGSTAPPAACTPAQLTIKAVVGKPTYAVGAQPVLTLQVTNNGPKPCVQNVADSQIVLRVYNGASRVWGSHDCQIQPGTDLRTLEVGTAAGFSIVWSGLTSQPKCAGTRQRVGAGTYTLYAALSGQEGHAAQFVIS